MQRYEAGGRQIVRDLRERERSARQEETESAAEQTPQTGFRPDLGLKSGGDKSDATHGIAESGRGKLLSVIPIFGIHIYK